MVRDAFGRLVRGHGVDRAKLPGQPPARRRRLNDQHTPGASGPGKLQREQPDRAGSLHDDRIAGRDPAAPHAVEGDRGRLDLRGHLVGQVRVSAHDPGRLDGNAAGEPAVRRRERISPPGDQRCRTAVLAESPLALRAATARGRDREDDAVPLMQAVHVRSGLGHLADPLVPAHGWAVQVPAPERVDVRPADPAQADVDGDATGFGGCLGEPVECHRLLSGDQGRGDI